MSVDGDEEGGGRKVQSQVKEHRARVRRGHRSLGPQSLKRHRQSTVWERNIWQVMAVWAVSWLESADHFSQFLPVSPQPNHQGDLLARYLSHNLENQITIPGSGNSLCPGSRSHTPIWRAQSHARSCLLRFLFRWKELFPVTFKFSKVHFLE